MNAARRRGALCTTAMRGGFVCTFHGHRYGELPHLLFELTLPSQPSERSGVGVILTSAARSGGEVRITETERSERVSAGRRGCRRGGLTADDVEDLVKRPIGGLTKSTSPASSARRLMIEATFVL